MHSSALHFQSLSLSSTPDLKAFFDIFFIFPPVKVNRLFVCYRFLTGQVDKRTLEKYEREAKEKNRETWYLAWALDTNQEERNKV